MSGLELIELLKEKELLSERTVEKLRRQIEESPKTVSAEALAKLLVKKGHLTEKLARKLLSQLSERQGRPDQSDALELLPIDDELLEEEPVAELEELEEADLTVAEEVLEPVSDEPVAADQDAKSLDGVLGDEHALHDHDVLGDHDLGDAGEPDAAGVTVRPKKKGLAGLFGRSSGSAPRKKYQARWDSPLMLVGGGALLLLAFAAVGLWFYLTRGTGDDAFAFAMDDYRQQSYVNAISKFERFLADYPDHPKVSQAKVQIGLATIWSDVDRGRWESALTAARTELPKIDGEEAFGEARSELATILPDIMEGFADRATEAQDISGAQKYLDQANEAYQEVNNSAYLPTSVRQSQQQRIEDIQKKLEAVKFRISQDEELVKTVADIGAAAQDQQIAAAYELRKRLLSKYPGLENDARLVEAVLNVSQAERSAVQTLTELPQGASDDHPAVAQFNVTLAVRRGGKADGVQGRVIFALAQGAVYGLTADTGDVLWRRYVGIENPLFPVPLGSEAGSDVLLVDTRRSELVRLRAETGELAWRLPFDQRVSAPVVAGGKIYIGYGDDAPGRLVEVDPESGQVATGVSFPTGIVVGPVLDGSQNQLVQVGAHSSVYVLDSSDWLCQDVFYLGHAKGTVAVPPVLVEGHIVIAENPGPDFSLIHVLGRDAETGALRPVVEPIRLQGQVVVPLVPFGRRVMVATNYGKIQAFEIDPNAPGEVIRNTASVAASVAPGTVSYPLLDQGRLWVADHQFSKYELQTSRGQLVRKWINSKGDEFIGPLQREADVLFHVRKRRNRLGVTVAAVRIEPRSGGSRDGEVVWEIDLGVPPAGEPFVNRAVKEIDVVSGNAALFALNASAIRAGIVDQPKSEVIDARMPPLRHSLMIPGARAVFFGDPVTNEMLLFDPSKPGNESRPVTLDLQSSKPGALPVAYKNGLLVAAREGPVYHVDAESGTSQIHPFQPPLQPGTTVDWLRATVTSDGESAILTERSGRIFKLTIQDKTLVAVAQAQADHSLVAPLATLGNSFFSAARSGGTDSVVRFDAGELKSNGVWPLNGRVVWGPEQVGDQILVASDANELLCLDEEDVRWRVEVNYGRLAGNPLIQDGNLVFTSVRGMIWRVDGQTGNELMQVDVGEPLGTGPVTFSGDRLLVCGGDGTVHIVNLPSN